MFFGEKNELPPKKKTWYQVPGMGCPVPVVPGFSTKVEENETCRGLFSQAELLKEKKNGRFPDDSVKIK